MNIYTIKSDLTTNQLFKGNLNKSPKHCFVKNVLSKTSNHTKPKQQRCLDSDPKEKKMCWSEDQVGVMESIRNTINLFINTFKNIPLYFTKKSFLLQGISGGLILLFAVAISAIITLWPQHDIILYPEYWYEPLGPNIVGYLTISTANLLIDAWTVMKVDVIWSWSSYLELFLSTLLGFVVPYVAFYIVWVYFFEKRHPMPFIGQICLCMAYLSKSLSFWFLFPHNLRVHNKVFRRRLLSYLSLFPIYFLIGIGYTQISSLFFVVTEGLQWCLGIFLPIFKKFNTWICTKVAFKAAGRKDISAKLAMICMIGSMHSFSVALLLGSKITTANAFLVMSLDCIPNILSCVKIVKQNRVGLNNNNECLQNEALKCLTLIELLKSSIPIIYCASFLVAYYGPNAKVLGNIQNDYWQYEKVNDIFGKLGRIAIFLIFDVIRGTTFGVILWRYCKLNVYQTYCYLVRQHGILIFMYIAGCLTVVMSCYHTYLRFTPIHFDSNDPPNFTYLFLFTNKVKCIGFVR